MVTPSDKILRVTAANDGIRAFFASTQNTVETARTIHNTTPVATAALGRLLTAALMMAQMLKEENGSVTLQIKGDGELGGVLAVGKPNATVKGYAENPFVSHRLNAKGKLDVSGAICQNLESSFLTVVKDIGMREPYVGQIPLVSGEIAEDLTAYFAQSEQTPSAVALGVLVNRDFSVLRAGGFIIQLLPFADNYLAEHLENKLKNLPNVTSLLQNGLESVVETVLGDINYSILEEIPVKYMCDCSRERVHAALLSIKDDDIFDSDNKAEVCCHFCNKKYQFVKDT